MKKTSGKIASILAAAVLFSSLAGCATTPQQGSQHVKCPACGYEFEMPAGK